MALNSYKTSELLDAISYELGDVSDPQPNQMLGAVWAALHKKYGAFADNTISTDLATSSLAIDTIVGQVVNRMAPLGRCATMVEGRQINADLTSMEVPRITVTPTTQESPTDLETGDSTLVADTITATHLSTSVHAGKTAAAIGVDQLARTAVNTHAATVWSKYTTLLDTGTFSTALTGAAASFTTGDMATAAAAVETADRVLLLSSTAFANIAGALWWNGEFWIHPSYPFGVWECDMSGTGTSSVFGAVGSRRAIVGSLLAPRLADGIERNDRVTSQTVNLPQLNASALLTAWANPRYRTAWRSIECLCGFAVADAAALQLLVEP